MPKYVSVIDYVCYLIKVCLYEYSFKFCRLVFNKAISLSTVNFMLNKDQLSNTTYYCFIKYVCLKFIQRSILRLSGVSSRV